MAKVIVSENSDVVLCSHRGLSPADIVEDCLEKAKSLLFICTGGFDMNSLPLESQHQYLSLVDDLVDLALRQFSKFQAGYDDEKV
jgi:hypothetical protein